VAREEECFGAALRFGEVVNAWVHRQRRAAGSWRASRITPPRSLV